MSKKKMLDGGFCDEFAAREKAEAKRRAEYLDGLRSCRVAVKSDGVDFAFVASFFADRVAEFDAGTVSRYSYPIWDTIGYVLSFDMEFVYAFVEAEPGRKVDIKRDICGSSDVLPASDGQNAIAKGLSSCLIAAAALARRIGSSTYDVWRKLLVQVEFEARHGYFVFATKGAFDKFLSKYTEQLQLLWADNEIFRHFESVQTIAQKSPPHPQKHPKNQKK